MISVTTTKWLLRLGLPVTGLVIALLCGRTIGGAFGILLLTALLLIFLAAMPFTLIGVLFVPILGLYGLRYSSRSEPEMDLRDPDTRLFLALGVPAALATVGLLSLYFPK